MASQETRKKALAGSVWTLFGYGGAQVIRLGSNLVLAHLLFPAAFGVMALVGVFMQGLQMFSEVGIGPSIIQNRRGDDPAFLNTAWTIQVVRGFALWIFSCLLAWPAAAFFGRNDPMAGQLLYILPVIGVSSILGGFNSTAVFSLNRHLQVGKATLLELVPQLVSVIAMIVWAWLSPSVWALVGGWLFYSIVRLLMSHYLNRPMRNRFVWESAAAQDLMRFGKWIFLGTIVAFLSGSLDRILLGKLLTLEELGIYSIALTFARVGIEVSTRLSHTVLFPILSRSQDDPVTLVGQSIRARGLILLAGGALVCGFAISAPAFFRLLYDQRYATAGTVAQWLAILVWFTIVLSSMERVPLALGHPRALFVSNLLTTLGYAIAVPAYWFAGLPGFILGIAAGSLFAHLVLLLWVPLRRDDMLRQTVLYSLVFGLYAGISVALLRLMAGRVEPHWEIVGAGIGTLIPCAVAGAIALRRLRTMR